jgi:hypothetical protein
MRFGWYCGSLGRDVVLVDESAKDLLAADPALGKADRLGWAGLPGAGALATARPSAHPGLALRVIPRARIIMRVALGTDARFCHGARR